jgi:hypothetical protein
VRICDDPIHHSKLLKSQTDLDRKNIFYMLYSYRYPDLAARANEKPDVSKLSEQEAVRLVERRKWVRSLPVPAVTEFSDSEALELWTQALKESGT